MKEIKFGTDGWRGIIADTFTFENVRKASLSLALYLEEKKKTVQPVVIGYDSRFLSQQFAEESAKALFYKGIPVLISREPIPTAALSFQVLQAKASCGIMITASHNPPEFNGFKLKAEFGGSAPQAMTDEIQICSEMVNNLDLSSASLSLPDEIKKDFLAPYLNHIQTFVHLDIIKKSRRRFMIDSMHGVGGTIIENLLSGGECTIQTIHSSRDPYFGGIHPEPLEKNLGKLSRGVKDAHFDLGIATDGDADRIGAIANDGTFASSLTITPLVALHLIENKRQSGDIAKTFAHTVYLDRIARRYALPLHTRPIGFKYIAELMLQKDILIGGEESGGIGIKGYFPERDGILIGLLLFEMICQTNQSFLELKRQLWEDYGTMEYARIDLKSIPKRGKELTKNLSQNPPTDIGGFHIKSVDTLDGIKFIFDDESWLLIRQSGTEPVLRIYSEASAKEKLEKLLKAGKEMVEKVFSLQKS